MAQNRIAKKLIIAIILCSSLVTVFLTIIQLISDYKQDIGLINQGIETIENTYLPSISHSVWVLDEELLMIQLESIIQQRDLEFLVVSGSENQSWQVGSITSQRTISKELPLKFEFNGQLTDIGTIHVVAGLDDLYQRLLKKAGLILLGNGFKAFIVAIFALALFQYLVTRHLRKMAEHTQKITLDSPTPDLVLDRKVDNQNEMDEIDQVVSAINKMNQQLALDLEEQQKYQQNLEVDERRYRQLLESTKTIPWELDLTTNKFTYFGAQAEEVLGYPVNSWKNLETWSQRIHPQDVNEAVNYCQTMSSQGKDHQFVYRAIHADGSIRWIHNIISVVEDTGGPKRLVGFLHDITELKNSEKEREELHQQLRQSYKMEAIGTLAGGIAHDFNNILAAILGYAEMALTDIPEKSQAYNSINQVLTAGNRAKMLVEQILAFSRKETMERQVVSLPSLINEGLTLLRASIPTTIKITEDIQLQEANILASPVQIQQILINLGTNAAHAMEEHGGFMEIELSEATLSENDLSNTPGLFPGDYVCLTIRDTGTGISENHLDRIFDPYFTTKSVGKGSGMGLAVVHGIVKSHDGMITVDSKLHTGTTVNIYFPLVESTKDTAETTDDSSQLPCGDEHILIVDDETEVLNITKLRLERLGYNTTTTCSSNKALELYRDDPQAYDLVISDQTMPDLTGDKLARQLKKIRPDVSVIICSGYSLTLDQNSAKAIGIKAFIQKPTTTKELAMTIRKILDEN